MAWLSPKSTTEKYVPDYCHSIEAAFEIVNEFAHIELRKTEDDPLWECTLESKTAFSDTAPVAIVLAFLKLKEDK